VRLRGAAMSSSRAAAQAAAAQLAPRSAIARGPRNAMHGMSAAGTHAWQRLVTALAYILRRYIRQPLSGAGTVISYDAVRIRYL
jgi:hypothetical protein